MKSPLTHSARRTAFRRRATKKGGAPRCATYGRRFSLFLDSDSVEPQAARAIRVHEFLEVAVAENIRRDGRPSRSIERRRSFEDVALVEDCGPTDFESTVLRDCAAVQFEFREGVVRVRA